MGAVDLTEYTDNSQRRDARQSSSLERRLEQLPDRHPSGPEYSRGSPSGSPPDGSGPGEADKIRPLTDAEHAEHVTEVRKLLADAHSAGMATDRQYTIDAKGKIWASERDAVHDSLVTDLYEAAASVPCEGRAILAGGPGGAGKTTILREYAGIDLSQYLMINPDAIKEQMARRGLIPEVKGLSPMEASDLVHEECSDIAKRLAHRAEADRKNVIWDITMSTDASTAKRIDSLRVVGYTHVEGVFVDVPVEVSAKRADARHREGHDHYRAGDGLGGRYVPPEVVRAQTDETWGSKNRANFEQVKDRFDAWSRYDNSVDGGPPVRVETSGEGQHRDVRTAR